MKPKEIIEQLQRMDPNEDVLIAIGTYTTAFPAVYITPYEVAPQSGRIYVNLPEGYWISKRKGVE
jgi:hypothetical protein